jgi:hypothetical protein
MTQDLNLLRTTSMHRDEDGIHRTLPHDANSLGNGIPV